MSSAMSVRLCVSLRACLMVVSFHSSSQAMPSIALTSALCSMNKPCKAATFVVGASSKSFHEYWQHVMIIHYVCEALRLALSLYDGSQLPQQLLSKSSHPVKQPCFPPCWGVHLPHSLAHAPHVILCRSHYSCERRFTQIFTVLSMATFALP